VSQQNVEVVRRAWEAALRHENDEIFRLYDPDVEIEVLALDHSGPYRGLDGVGEWWRSILGAFSLVDSTVEEWIDGGDDIVAVMRMRARGRKSGVPVESHEAHVWTVRNGKLWRLRIYPTRDEALGALGLEG
jgi:ketosteroid isomerase-like protein